MADRVVQERGRVDQILAFSSSPTAFRWKRLPWMKLRDAYHGAAVARRCLCPQQLPGDPASPATRWRAYPSRTAFRGSGVNSCPMSRPASYGPSNAGRRTSFCESGIAVGRIKSSHRGKRSLFLPQPSRETEKALWLPKSRRRSLPRLSSEL
jgi:hypothetical protein